MFILCVSHVSLFPLARLSGPFWLPWKLLGSLECTAPARLLGPIPFALVLPEASTELRTRILRFKNGLPIGESSTLAPRHHFTFWQNHS